MLFAPGGRRRKASTLFRQLGDPVLEVNGVPARLIEDILQHGHLRRFHRQLALAAHRKFLRVNEFSEKSLRLR
jgi:hypothetical protein